MTEANVVLVKIQGEVTEQKSEKFKDSIRLTLEMSNRFTRTSEEIDVKLTESVSNEDPKYREDKLERAFDVIREQTGTDIQPPAEITVEAIQKALEPVVGQSIEVFIGETEIKDENGAVTESRRYYSLSQGGDIEYLRADTSAEELMQIRPDITMDKSFLGRIVGFAVEDNTKYFTNNNPQNAEMVEETKTRHGLAVYMGKLLKQDGSDQAKKLMNKLAEYIKKNTIDGEYIGTTSGALKSVGAFSDKSYSAEGLDDATVMRLKNLISKESKRGRAYTASVRLLFNVQGAGDKIFKTRRLNETPYPKKGETLVVTFNPKDTNSMEFSKMIEPLFNLGVLSEADLDELDGMKEWYEIINKLQSAINEHNVYARLSLGKVSGNHTFNLLAFEFPQEHDIVRNGSETLEHNTDSDLSDEPVAKKEEPKQEESGSVFDTTQSSLDISDDDLPF